VRLGEVLTPTERGESPVPGTTYRQIGVKLWGEGAYEREQMDGGATKYTQLFRAEPEDVIVNKIWARNGSVAVVPSVLAGCFGSSEFPMFAPKRDRLQPRWMHWLTKTPGFWAQCDEKSQGTSGKNRIKPEQFLRVEIPLPPLAEQRRVVARIEELAAQIHKACTLRQQAAEEADALMERSTEKMFTTVGQSTGRQRLGEHVRLQGGYAFKSDEYLHTGLRVVRIANLENETVHTEGSPCVAESRLEEFRRFVLQPGEILVAMTGATTGKLGIVPDSCKNWLLNQRVGRFVPRRPTELEPKYAYWLARGVQRVIFETAYGGAQPNISPNDIEALEFPFPPLPEQRRIVAELDALQAEVDALKRLQVETAAELDALLPAILDKAFKGKL
jgi:type I restriction enzyme S subunit